MNSRVPTYFTEEEWLNLMKDLENRPSTINDYRKVLNLLGKQYNIKEMTPADGRQYFNQLEASTLSPNTIHRYQATLRSIGMKMEKHPQLYPGYKNPFANILHNEVRKPSTYNKEMFANPSDIQKIKQVLPSLPLDKQLIITFMLEIGMMPKHIQALRVCDFKRFNNEVLLTYKDGPYITQEEIQSPTLRNKKVSSTKTITYDCYPTFHFFDEYSKLLFKKLPTLGVNDDTRYFFLTSRHQPYSYRAIHHLVQDVCTKAGLAPDAVTPMQLSYFGSIHSYLLTREVSRINKLNNELENETDEHVIRAIQNRIKESEYEFVELAKIDWIGTFDSGYPYSRLRMIQSIRKQLGEDFLKKVLGI